MGSLPVINNKNGSNTNNTSSSLTSDMASKHYGTRGVKSSNSPGSDNNKQDAHHRASVKVKKDSPSLIFNSMEKESSYIESVEDANKGEKKPWY